HATAQRLQKNSIGWLPKCPEPPRTTEKGPPQTEPRDIKIDEKKGPVPIVGCVFRTVPQNHPDQVAIDMLMSILGGGQSSRLYHDLVKKQKVCQVALAGAFLLEGDGLAGARAGVVPLVWGKGKGVQGIGKHILRNQGGA